MLTVVAFFVLLGVLITVHELGHFLVAKASGVRVLTFSIGFGPRLFGFRRGETDYRVSILPLGGYVRMYGDDITEEVPAEEAHRAFLHQPFLKKSAIAVAGPAANLLLPVALFFMIGVGTERVPAPVVGTVLTGQAADEAGLRPGDRVLAIDGEPIDRYSQFQAYVEPRPGVPIALTINRAGEVKDLTVTPRAMPSPTVFERDRTVGRLGVVASAQLPIVVVTSGSPAARAGVKDLDRVLSVNGTAVNTRSEFEAALDGALAAAFRASTNPVQDPGRALTPNAAPNATLADPGAGAVVLELERREPVPDGSDDKTTGETVRQVRVTLLVSPEPAATPSVVERDRFGVTGDELLDSTMSARIEATAEVVRAEAARTERQLGLGPADGRVAHVLPGTVAAERGFAAGKQRIVAIDGKRVLTSTDLENALRADPDGIHSVGMLDVDGRPSTLTFRMLPAPDRQLGGVKIFGVVLLDTFGEGELVERTVSPAEALGRAFASTGTLVLDVFRGFGMLFSGQVGLESLGGPITIAKMSGQAAQLGAGAFVHLMGLISVNLAVINLLPIPVLDGGHLLMFVIEFVTRKRLSVQTRMSVTKIGLAVVGLLMVVAIGNDILGLF